MFQRLLVCCFKKDMTLMEIDSFPLGIIRAIVIVNNPLRRMMVLAYALNAFKNPSVVIIKTLTCISNYVHVLLLLLDICVCADRERYADYLSLYFPLYVTVFLSCVCRELKGNIMYVTLYVCVCLFKN